MNNRLPALTDKYKICIICEGDEEFEYLQRLNSLGVWNKCYEFKLINAKGNGNVVARYQDRFQKGTYDLVLAFCDTDGRHPQDYLEIKTKINDLYGKNGAADKVVIYGSPCTLQIILSHWVDPQLSNPSKKANADLIERVKGIENYSARGDQRKKLMERITQQNYYVMRDRVACMNNSDTVNASTNFGVFINYFESVDVKWIQKLKKQLQ